SASRSSESAILSRVSSCHAESAPAQHSTKAPRGALLASHPRDLHVRQLLELRQLLDLDFRVSDTAGSLTLLTK
ncbi:hypothetical protein PF011_g33184, partial [Phytophthora fragariae]